MTSKLVVVVRTDLGMGRGKIAAQVAHAAVAAALRSHGSAMFAAWWRDGQPKVVLKVSGEDQLTAVCAAALKADLPVEVVHDAGRTQVAARTADIDAVAGTLPLL